jgi:hypothetical protein
VAETAPAKVPAFAQRLLAEKDEDRLATLESEHPDYTAHSNSWTVLIDSFEGGGGFLDGSYLWPYPSEESPDYMRRQQMARYHNYVETLVDLYVRFMFTQGVKRDSTNQEFNDWLNDVDGAGSSIDGFLKRFAALALVPGHAAVLVDKTPDQPTGPAKSDEKARVFATIYTATSIVDWRFDGNVLAGVKLKESTPQTDIATEWLEDDEAERWLVWDREGWARFNTKGELLEADVPGLDLVPFVVLRPKPSLLSPMRGRALVSNVNVVRALFNRASEEDEVLRTQAFSLLTVNVPTDGNVQQAREQVGSAIGTAKALVVQGEIDYKTPDQNVPAAIRDNIGYLVQELYRAAHMRFNRDSLAAETAESIRLQHSELNEMLQGFAKAMSQAEKDIARAWFAWTYPTKEAADAAFEAANVEATYPQEFFLDALMTDLEAWAEGIRMQLGDTLGRRLKKKAARRLDPEMPADVLEQVDAEIDKLPVEPPSPFGMDLGVNPDGTPKEPMPMGEAA